MNTHVTDKSAPQRGFTLVELVVVIAILGVLSAVAVPFITRHLEESKDRAYESDRERFQQAVDAYYSSPNNENFLGNPQYPIMGMSKAGGTFLQTFQPAGGPPTPIREPHDAAHVVDVNGPPFDHTVINEDVTKLGNPLRGTRGGKPKWIDDGNGIRDGGDQELLDSDAASLNKPGWHVEVVTREGVKYTVDSRDFFIDFDKLAEKNLIDEVPSSASPDNRPQDPPGPFNLIPADSGQPDNQAPAGLSITPPTTTVALWVVDDGSGEVFQYSLDGALLKSFPLKGSNGNPSGIATSGSSLLVLDRVEFKVYRYNTGGGPQGSFNVTTQHDGLVGITSDGTNTWILNVDSDGNGEVFQYSSSGIAQGVSFQLVEENSAPLGITTVGRDFWVVDEGGVDGNGVVFRYNVTGTHIGTPFSVGPISQPGGIATDGINIWVADRSTGRIFPFGLDGNPPGPSTPGLYDGSYSWYVDRQGQVQSLSFFFPEADKTGFQTAYP